MWFKDAHPLFQVRAELEQGEALKARATAKFVVKAAATVAARD